VPPIPAGSAKPFKSLSRGRFLEVVAYVVELYQRESARVVFDAKIPERETGQLRQVDIAIIGTVSRRPFLRIVEVRDRSRPADKIFIDQVIGKRQALGAHRATVVSTAASRRVLSVELRSLQKHSTICPSDSCLLVLRTLLRALLNSGWEINFASSGFFLGIALSPHISRYEVIRVFVCGTFEGLLSFMFNVFQFTELASPATTRQL